MTTKLDRIAGSAGWQLPDHTVETYAPKSSAYCIATPVLNEGSRIAKQLEKLQKACPEIDVLICDGGSTDGCTNEELMRRLGVRTVIRKKGPGKMSAQLRLLFAYALQEEYAGVICIDGNNKDGVHAAPLFEQKLREGHHIVVGSRYAPGGEAINTPLDRHLAIKLVHAPLISLAAGKRMTDTTNGFRAFSRELLLDPRVQPFRDVFDVYNLPYYLVVRGCRLGYSLAELPVSRAYPPTGPTPSKIKGIRSKISLLGEIYGTIRGAYNPN